DVPGDLVGPGVAHRRLEAQHVVEVAAALPDRDQLADVGEGVAAGEQLGDQPQPGQVRLGVDADPPFPPGWREQPSVLVDAHIAHGRVGEARQLVDAVFGHGPSLWILRCFHDFTLLHRDNARCNVPARRVEEITYAPTDLARPGRQARAGDRS